jgi:hypothetical protein
MTIETLTVDRALQTINNLQQNLEQARRENRHLRRKTETMHPYRRTTGPRILRRALDDSTAMLVLWASDYTISRRFVYELGISERRYSWALGLLRSARIVAPRGSSCLIDDFITAEARLKTEYERLKGRPNALERLRLYMPRNRQYMYEGKRR